MAKLGDGHLPSVRKLVGEAVTFGVPTVKRPVLMFAGRAALFMAERWAT